MMLPRLVASAPLLAQLVLAAPGQGHHRHEHRGVQPTTTVTVNQVTTLVKQLAPVQTTVDATTLTVSEESTVVNETIVEEVTELESRATGKRNVLYFTNWGIYGANFQPQQIPADVVTHLLYSFMDIGDDGTVKSSDSWSDIQKHYSTDSWNDSGNNIYGCAKQLYILKKKYRKFKTLMSIGGWTYSSKFAPVAADSAKRKTFAASAVKLLADWGFDGIDIDWEYPASSTEAANYVLLLKEVRSALDTYAKNNSLSYHFLMTVASPAGASHYNTLNLAAMDKYLDAWHLMAYDYAGSWDATTGHQAALYHSNSNPTSTPFRTHGAVVDYVAAGVPASKIVMGMPLYGRSFANAAGIGLTYSGVGGGSVVQGVWNYNALPRSGAKVYFNSQAVATYSYDAGTKELVTYESLTSAKVKVNYIHRKGMGGAMYWEASGDRNDSSSIVRYVANKMGTLESSRNMLSYPASVYDNLRAGMPSS